LARAKSETREIKVCGFKAVTATFAVRPKCILRLFYTPEMFGRVGEYCRVLAQDRKPYRQVMADELERIAGTVHHGGIVAVTERPALQPPRFGDLTAWQREGHPILFLDRIGNPHNLGAIARTAAFFGITRMVIQRHAQQALPNDSAYRVAEGGLEHVHVYLVNDMLSLAKQLAPHFLVVGTSSHTGKPVEAARPPRAPGRPVALLLGNEEAGLDPKLAGQCELLVRVAGSGAVESLNVSTAAAILLHWITQGSQRKVSSTPALVARDSFPLHQK
jgi:TrmH RNA methyltransferase